MATRSTIALEFADGTVQQVYCHFDGYLEGVGAQLRSSYMDPFALRELINGGDMSTIGEPYTERGEDLCVRYYANFGEYVANGQQEEYNYILRCINGVVTWFVLCHATDGEWVPFAEAMKMENLG